MSAPDAGRSACCGGWASCAVLASATGDLVDSIPGWTINGNFTVATYGASGGFPTVADPGPADRGNAFFSGGPNNTASSISQSISLVSYAGLIDSGNELFTPDFAGGHYASGLAALASLDSNHDGVINSADQDFAKLVVWQDADHNGVSGAGELHSLIDLGITEITAAAGFSRKWLLPPFRSA